jgi:hypothetical protein
VTTRTTLGLLALLICSAATADELRGGAWSGIDRAPMATLYLEFPVTPRQHAPMLGFRLQRHGAIGLEAMRADRKRQSTILLDVRFNARKDREAETQALSLLGPGAITGIVVGAVIGVAVLTDDDDGGGGY